MTLNFSNKTVLRANFLHFILVEYLHCLLQFCFKEIYFVIFPPLPGVLHLRCDNGNLWRMELFWKVFPGCLFSDETHSFLLLSLLWRTRGGKWSFHSFSPTCQRDKICSLKIELSQIVSRRSRARTDRGTPFDYWGQSPTSSLHIHNLPS